MALGVKKLSKLLRSVKPSISETLKREEVKTYLEESAIRRIASPIPDDAVIIDRYQTGYRKLATVFVYTRPDGSYVYHIEEPPISMELENLYKLVRESIQALDVEIPEDAKEKESIYENLIYRILHEHGAGHVYERNPELIYYLIRDIVGWRIIDVLMRDPLVEEIDYSSPNSPVSIVLKHEKVPVTWVDTNIHLSEAELMKLIEFLAFKTGKNISVANPLLEARTPEGYRLAANLKEVSNSPAFTIRKHTEKPLSITQLIKFKTLSPLMGAYLWTLVENMRFVLVIGEMASGKTTLLQALTSAIPKDKKVLTIEDTPELKLAHPRWQALYTRRSVYGSEQDIDLYDLGRYALRTRAQYIIIGEVRDREINTLIQMASSGHGSACTFHAESPVTLFLRLTSPPLNVQPSFLLTISAIVLQRRAWSRKHKQFIRRTSKIWEITGIKSRIREGEIPVEYTEVFTWDPMEDKHYPDTIEELIERSRQIQLIAQSLYGEEDWYDMIYWELEEKTKFLIELVNRNVFDFREVTEAIYRKTLEMRR
jgi:flagellar protein FlaI